MTERTKLLAMMAATIYHATSGLISPAGSVKRAREILAEVERTEGARSGIAYRPSGSRTVPLPEIPQGVEESDMNVRDPYDPDEEE